MEMESVLERERERATNTLGGGGGAAIHRCSAEVP